MAIKKPQSADTYTTPQPINTNAMSSQDADSSACKVLQCIDADKPCSDPPTEKATAPEDVKSAFGVFYNSLSPQVIYLTTAAIGVMCAMSVYQSYGNLTYTHSNFSVKSLERHGYSGDPNMRVKKGGYGSTDLLTKMLKNKLLAQWSETEPQDVPEDGGRRTKHVSGGVRCGVEKVKGCGRQYVVVFDAGSTGTRLHVYLFMCEKGEVRMEKEVFIKATPGLSEFVSQPGEGAASLQTMIDRAMWEVPMLFHASTPLVFKATAGFRLLSSSSASRLLNKIRERFAHTNFQFTTEDINIMSGREEGLYAWLTINYLSGWLDGVNVTAAVMDMGGASMQLTYQPLNMHNASKKLYQLKLLCSTYHIYTHSYLGSGLMAARHAGFTKGDDGTLSNDCLPAGYTGVFTFGGQSYAVSGPGEFSRDACWYQVGRVLSSRPVDPQWGLVGRERRQHLYLISYFYETLQWAGVIGHETEKIVTVGDFYNASCSACERPNPKHPFLCFDLTYITRLLGEGFLLWNTPLHVVSEINSGEASWALGAALHELSGMFD